MQESYSKLCRYAHSRAGHTNYDIWQSNGPVFIGRGFTQFWTDFCDAIALSDMLLKKPMLPERSATVRMGESAWNGIGEAVEAEFFAPSER